MHFYTKFSITNNQAYTVTAILLLPESNLVWMKYYWLLKLNISIENTVGKTEIKGFKLV